MRWKLHVRFGGSGLNILYMLVVYGNTLTLGLSSRPYLLTTIIMPIALLSNWDSIKENVKSYLIIMLLLETLLLAVFLALDIMIFYIFFESILPPAIWFGKSLIRDPKSLYSAPASRNGGGHRTVIKQINKFRLYSTAHKKPEFELNPNFVGSAYTKKKILFYFYL